jgi:cytochrome c
MRTIKTGALSGAAAVLALTAIAATPTIAAGITWDDANLHAYIKDPQAKVKGNRMPFGGLSSDADIDDVIAYLKDYK